MPYLTTIERFAQIRATRQALVAVLEARFGAAPENVQVRLETVNDPEQLLQLLRQASTVDSIADFEALFSPS